MTATVPKTIELPSDPATSAGQVEIVPRLFPTEMIVSLPENPVYTTAMLADLVPSVEKHGFLVPGMVAPSPDLPSEEHRQCLEGHRRLAVARLLNRPFWAFDLGRFVPEEERIELMFQHHQCRRVMDLAEIAERRPLHRPYALLGRRGREGVASVPSDSLPGIRRQKDSRQDQGAVRAAGRGSQRPLAGRGVASGADAPGHRVRPDGATGWQAAVEGSGCLVQPAIEEAEQRPAQKPQAQNDHAADERAGGDVRRRREGFRHLGGRGPQGHRHPPRQECRSLARWLALSLPVTRCFTHAGNGTIGVFPSKWRCISKNIRKIVPEFFRKETKPPAMAARIVKEAVRIDFLAPGFTHWRFTCKRS